MRGDGPDATARDIEGEVDRALRRPAQRHGHEQGHEHGHEQGAAQHPRTVRREEVRDALERAIAEGRGIVVLEVRRPGEGVVRARVPQVLWDALCDALSADSLEQEAQMGNA